MKSMQSFSFASVVVSATYLLALTGNEAEDNSKLLVHANTMKAGEISFKLLQPVRGRNSQIFERSSCIQQIEFLLYPAPKYMRQLASGLAVAPMKNVGRRGVRKTDNHRF